jgi:hypothetical protein
MLDELDKPHSARSGRHGNRPDDCRSQRQHHDEGHQASPAISSEVAPAEPEIVIGGHESPPFQHREFVLCSNIAAKMSINI